ncbi:MAG: hypothetical protein ABI706_13725 [Ilumatobacteraceae bacterium]
MRISPPRRHLATWATLAVALVAGLVILIVSLASSSGPAKRTLAGTFTLTPRAAQTGPCSPSPAYPDLVDGAAIVVRDGHGNQVGTGRLGTGRAQGGSCVRSLDIEPVPELAEYRIVVGTRGPMVITTDTLKASGGVLDLRFGT